MLPSVKKVEKISMTKAAKGIVAKANSKLDSKTKYFVSKRKHHQNVANSTASSIKISKVTVNISFLKFKIRNTRKRCKIRSKFTIKASLKSFEHISHLLIVLLLGNFKEKSSNVMFSSKEAGNFIEAYLNFCH